MISLAGWYEYLRPRLLQRWYFCIQWSWRYRVKKETGKKSGQLIVCCKTSSVKTCIIYKPVNWFELQISWLWCIWCELLLKGVFEQTIILQSMKVFFFFNCPFIPDLGLTCKSTDLSITLLNIQSLQKHAIDISGDVRFHTDILSFPYRNKSSLMKIFLT